MRPLPKHLIFILSGLLAAACAIAEETRVDSLVALTGVWRAKFNHDGSRVLVQDRGGLVGMYDVESGKTVPGDLGAMIQHGTIVMKSDAKEFLVSFEEGGVRAYDATTAKTISPRLNLKPVESWLSATCFAPDGRTVVLFEQDGTANAFDLESGRLLARLCLETPLKDDQLEPGMQSEFSADGKSFFIMDTQGVLRRFRTADWQPEGKALVHPHRDGYSFGFVLSRDGLHALTSEGAGELGPKVYLQLWDLQTAEPVGKAFESRDSIGGSFLPGGRRLLVRPGRGMASVHDLHPLEHVFDIRAHDDVYGPGVKLTPDAQWLLSWGANDVLLATDAETGKIAGVHSSKAHVGHVLVSPDSKRCYVFYDNTAFLLQGHHDCYVIQFGVPELKITGSVRISEFVSSVDLSPDGSRLLLIQGNQDRETVRVFDAQTLKPVLLP